MSDYIPQALRQLVFERANGRCEYCLLPQSASLHKHEPDHIVPNQHGGETDASNLALACMRCNRFKGPNVGSFDPQSGELVPFFNPRLHIWKEHFELENGRILPQTSPARVTLKILRLNDAERVQERQKLIQAGYYR